MPRRKTAILARKKLPDDHYSSVEVEMMIRQMTKEGKYQKACAIVRKALDSVFDNQVKKGPYKPLAEASNERPDRRSRADRHAQEEAEADKEVDLSKMSREDATVLILTDVLERAGPELELTSKRIGGANIQVPVVVKQGRKIKLAIRAVVRNARKRRKKDAVPMFTALASEIMDVIRGNAQTLVDKENLLKMARANAVYSGSRR